jgi:hypothetical protein
MMQSVMTYGSEACDVNRKNRNKVLATKMDYLRRSCRRTRLDRIRSEVIREMLENTERYRRGAEISVDMFCIYINRIEEKR